MQKLIGALIAPMLVVGPATAWSLTILNQDGESRRITITENGARSERDVAANETVKVCEKGCFITFPDGTLTAYKGSESIVIRNGGPALAK